MNGSRIIPIVAVLALFVACEDQPTAVNELDNLEPQLINTEKGKWVQLAFPPPVAWTAVFAGPCVPEPLLCEGATVAWGLEHAPPKKANTSILNFKSTYTEDSHCTGAQTGRWNFTDQNQQSAHTMTNPSDGKEYWTAILIDHLIDEDTGDKAHFQTVIWYVWNPSFPYLESFRFKMSCGPRSQS